MNEKKIINEISQSMLDKKALDVKIINVIGLTSLTDYFINCSSQSDPQTRAIKNHIEEKLLKKHNIKPLHIEGYELNSGGGCQVAFGMSDADADTAYETNQDSISIYSLNLIIHCVSLNVDPKS